MYRKTLYLIRGLPGSGKSTLAVHLLNEFCDRCGWENVDHWEADQYFVDPGGVYQFDASRLSRAHQWCHISTRKSMEMCRTVIVSNTFTTQSELRPYFELAVEYGYEVVVLTCKSRFKNVHNVPQESLDRMHKRFDYNAEDKLYEIYFPNA